MIGLDTNVLLRLFIEDGGEQPARAMAFVTERCTPRDPGFVTAVTMAELARVLADAFGRTKAETIEIFASVLSLTDVEVDPIAASALADWRSSRADFADHVISRAGRAAGCEATATFDKFAARSPGFIQIP